MANSRLDTATLEVLGYPIADALGIDLVYQAKHDWVRGVVKKDFEWVLGAHLNVQARIVDSLLDAGNRKLCVLTHFGGYVYIVLVHDDLKNSLLALVVDGEKLGFPSNPPPHVKFFKESWSRKWLYGKVLVGLKRVFRRGVTEDNWVSSPNAIKCIQEYLDAREQGVSAYAAKDSFLDGLV